jgi:endonuclease/exonuclease/phosphatase family metal-dependent hydrolase
MLTLMSFNIRYGSAPDGELSWPNRKDRLLKSVREIAPDLIGIQECRDDDQLKDVLAGLPGYAYHGVRRGGVSEAAPEMAPILFNTKSVQILESGSFWLSETPKIPGSQSWGASLPRTLAWLLVERRGRRIWFGNVHFDHESALARQKSAALVGAYIKSRPLGEAKVLTGDFNAEKGSVPYGILTSYLVDAFRISEITPVQEGTFHDFGRLAEPTSIDWVLVSDDLRIANAWVDIQPDAPFLSDHYSVVVHVRE